MSIEREVTGMIKGQKSKTPFKYVFHKRVFMTVAPVDGSVIVSFGGQETLVKQGYKFGFRAREGDECHVSAARRGSECLVAYATKRLKRPNIPSQGLYSLGVITQ